MELDSTPTPEWEVVLVGGRRRYRHPVRDVTVDCLEDAYTIEEESAQQEVARLASSVSRAEEEVRLSQQAVKQQKDDLRVLEDQRDAGQKSVQHLQRIISDDKAAVEALQTSITTQRTQMEEERGFFRGMQVKHEEQQRSRATTAGRARFDTQVRQKAAQEQEVRHAERQRVKDAIALAVAQCDAAESELTSSQTSRLESESDRRAAALEVEHSLELAEELQKTAEVLEAQKEHLRAAIQHLTASTSSPPHVLRKDLRRAIEEAEAKRDELAGVVEQRETMVGRCESGLQHHWQWKNLTAENKRLTQDLAVSEECNTWLQQCINALNQECDTVDTQLLARNAANAHLREHNRKLLFPLPHRT